MSTKIIALVVQRPDGRQQRRRPVAFPGGYGEQHNVAGLSVGE